MTYPIWLDLIGAFLGFAFIATLLAALLVSGRASRTTIRRLTRAIRLGIAATTIAATNLIVQALDIPDDGWIWPILWVINCGGAAYMTRTFHQRRDVLGDRVVREAEKTVRDYRPGA